jgi:H/ACA ribonucleoprotein complex subunit 4
MAKVEEGDFSIKPENVTPQIPTSEWPLLLKNYDKRMLEDYRNLLC